MSAPDPKAVGRVTWFDLTVPDAAAVRDFYQEVVGWTPVSVGMGGYDDFCMNLPASGETVAGVCNARGANAYLPPVWLPYINVADLDHSLARCQARGGKLIGGIRSMGREGRYCVIEDPAGAHAALFEPAARPSDTA